MRIREDINLQKDSLKTENIQSGKAPSCSHSMSKA
jgi:hypothetical protein